MATEAPMGVFDRVLLVSATGDRYVSPHSGKFYTWFLEFYFLKIFETFTNGTTVFKEHYSLNFNISARVEQAKQAINDQAQGRFNIEIVDKLQRNLEISPTKVERYHVYHQGLPQGKILYLYW